MRAPSPLIRRAVITPLILGTELLVLLFSPVLAALSALLSLLVGGRRPVRVLALVLAWAGGHLLSVAACWLVQATREDRGRYYAVMRWFVGSIAQTALRVARVKVTVFDSQRAEAVLASETPVVVLSIHSGEGDSLLVLDHLLRRHRRRPRIVMHEALSMDPLIDMLGRRLPNRFVDPRGGDIEVEIAAMSRGLGPRDAVVIFPEGGNFTERRRLAGIDRLRKRGLEDMARRSEAMRHVLPPRPGGVAAALAAAPDADVVWVAHAGLDHLHTVADVWRELPLDGTVRMRWWQVAAAEVPRGEQAQVDWLYHWWKQIDDWVDDTRRST